MWTLLIIGYFALQGLTDPFVNIGDYVPAAEPAPATECDSLAAHPEDPQRVAPGLPREAVDLDRAFEACNLALLADPLDPRLNYQMSRLYGFLDAAEERAIHLETALRAGYPHALLMEGLSHVSTNPVIDADVCYGGELIRRAAIAGHFTGMVGFVHYAVQGRFDACADYPPAGRDDLLILLDAAAYDVDTYIKRLILELLHDRVNEIAQPD